MKTHRPKRTDSPLSPDLLRKMDAYWRAGRTRGASAGRAGLLRKARGTLLRRATDPWESHLNGIMNTLVPEDAIPSHQGPDAQTVDGELDVVTMAVKVPETLGHLHYRSVQMTRNASKDEVLDAFRSSSRIALIRIDNGLSALNAVKELMADLRRPHADLCEVALWEDMLTVQGDELVYAYMVDNQAIVIPETIDAIRALANTEPDGAASARRRTRAWASAGFSPESRGHVLKPIFLDDLREAGEVLAMQWSQRPWSRRVAEAVGWWTRRWL